MKRLLTILLLVLPSLVALAQTPIDSSKYPEPVRVACIGDSITAGAGAGEGKSYPSQLQELLGDQWKVENFGVSGRTLLRKGDFPYWNEKAFQNSQDFQANAVIIMLGTNDTKPQNWTHRRRASSWPPSISNTWPDLSSFATYARGATCICAATRPTAAN